MNFPIETEAELKPCPFCGGEPKLYHKGKNGRVIKCTSCHIKIEQKVLRMTTEWLEVKMIEDWNNRI